MSARIFSMSLAVFLISGAVVAHPEKPHCQNSIASNPPSLLTEPEQKAIERYTTGYYHLINGVLRGKTIDEIYEDQHWRRRDVPTDAQMKGLISELTMVLGKLPDFSGTVYRGIEVGGPWTPENEALNQAVRERYVVGAVVTEAAFLSSSMIPGGKSNSGDTTHLFVIESQTGKWIEPYAHPHNQSEREVLFAPGKKFVVTSLRGTFTGKKMWDRSLTEGQRDIRDWRAALIRAHASLFKRFSKAQVDGKLATGFQPTIEIHLREL